MINEPRTAADINQQWAAERGSALTQARKDISRLKAEVSAQRVAAGHYQRVISNLTRSSKGGQPISDLLEQAASLVPDKKLQDALLELKRRFEYAEGEI